ncbi:hypothetical protein T10_7671 [Trichinella papuae]|uniref:Uncharacterized protein n=1 Tax=Trichinella papuae TaxID=268474 RepID=A0A0V1N1W0_9BILA|nr:hypothetical protein T10_7671 [Trichinella papuae]
MVHFKRKTKHACSPFHIIICNKQCFSYPVILSVIFLLLDIEVKKYCNFNNNLSFSRILLDPFSPHLYTHTYLSVDVIFDEPISLPFGVEQRTNRVYWNRKC